MEDENLTNSSNNDTEWLMQVINLDKFKEEWVFTVLLFVLSWRFFVWFHFKIWLIQMNLSDLMTLKFFLSFDLPS